MTRQIVTHTQQAYVLSLNIVTQVDNEFTLSSIPIVRLTRLIFAVYTLLQWFKLQWLIVQGLPHLVKQDALTFCESFYLLVETCRIPLHKTLAFNYQGGVL